MFYIRGRNSWGARVPRNTPTRDNWRRPVTLVVHHTAGSAPRRLKAVHAELRSIQYQHMSGSRGEPFNDIGYNYLIDRMGRVFEGRGFQVVGAHTLGQNTGTIGVSFMGNYEELKPTKLQLLAYHLLVRKLRRKGARITRVRGHKQMPNQATACPGRNLMRALKL